MSFGSDWFAAFAGILLIDLVLSGDNAVIIALASKNLSGKRRRQAIIWGSTGAVGLRVVMTFIAATLMNVPYLQFIGGLALIWIAIGLLGDSGNKVVCDTANCLRQAIQIILVADFIMSLDNVIALAAIAQAVPEGKYVLITLGLLVSIPLVVFGAQTLTKLIERFPVIVYFGAGVLGYAAAEMIINDKAVGPLVADYHFVLQAGLVFAVIAAGHWKKSQLVTKSP